jgi:hypothetical protein
MDLAVNHALDRARLGLLDLDRLDMVDLAGGRRFGDVNRARPEPRHLPRRPPVSPMPS